MNRVVWLLASGCLVDKGLYDELADELADADTDVDVDADSDVDSDTDTDVSEDGDGDGFAADVDCDDTDDGVFPGACEDCGDTVDQDCFGGDAECHGDLDVGFDLFLHAITYQGEVAGDFAGIAVSAAGDFNGDQLGDLVIGASVASPTGLLKAGSSYLLLAPFSGGSLTDADARYDGLEPDDRAGVAVGSLDFDADGFSDIVIGAKNHNLAAGAVYLVYGQPADPPDGTAFGDVVFSGSEDGELAGTVLAGAGNIDDLPGDDLIVGAEGAESNRGRVYLVSGRSPKLSNSDLLMSAGAFFRGEGPGNLFGSAVDDGGDIDGDDLHDLVVGALDADGTGAAYVWFGDPSFQGALPHDAADADHKLTGEGSGYKAGTSVSAGDFDGSGSADVVIGSRATIDGRGSVYVVGSSQLQLGSPGVPFSLTESHLRIYGETAQDRLGQSVSVPGDVNCDGFDDLLIGADGFPYGGEQGAVYLVFGGVRNTIVLPYDAEMRLVGNVGDKFGAYLSDAGDLDHDGADDMIIGAYAAGSGPLDQAGQAFVVFGTP